MTIRPHCAHISRARHPYRYYCPQAHNLKDLYGVGRTQELIEAIEPDVVWLLNDLPILRGYFQYGDEAIHQVPTVAYAPIDGDPFPAEYLAGFRQATVPLVYTQYALEVLRGMDAELAARTRVIPHGHDPHEFYPLADTKAACKRLALEHLGVGAQVPEDAFIVLRVDKNQERKNWPATLEAFALFCAGEPERRPYLWCHTVMDDGNGYNLNSHVRRLGLSERVLSSGLSAGNQGVPVEMLNAIYNVADVHLSTTAGGGWELSTHEAKAAGTPTITTRYAAMAEVGRRGGLLVQPLTHYYAHRNDTRYALVEPLDVAEALWDLAAPTRYQALRREALVWAQEMTWEANDVAARFDAAFQEAMARCD